MKDREPRRFRSPQGSPPATAAVPFDPPPSAPASPVDDAISRHRARILAIDGVTALDHARREDGTDVIRVHVTSEPAARNVPEELDGHPVVTVVTGTYEAY
ncbi:hypothetical protein ETD83_01635 [Actinomadura soli]|uniref:Uncharacterized protein n=1 Tax=Actinomadura soli TaxID=2508997 RepID=A0A5C4JKH5_9ACTN|nr:hypothetical protein [Actinomadura soli]TMR07148.1 hypothetical protein ETD83_01635 [Actinomadura soli]